MTAARTGSVTPDLTIGVVGPHDLVERVMLMGHGPTPVPSRLVAAAYRDAMVAELALIGVPEARVRALLAAVGELVAITFSPSSAFVQTPGPDAGRALEMPP